MLPGRGCDGSRRWDACSLVSPFSILVGEVRLKPLPTVRRPRCPEQTDCCLVERSAQRTCLKCILLSVTKQPDDRVDVCRPKSNARWNMMAGGSACWSPALTACTLSPACSARTARHSARAPMADLDVMMSCAILVSRQCAPAMRRCHFSGQRPRDAAKLFSDIILLLRILVTKFVHRGLLAPQP